MTLPYDIARCEGCIVNRAEVSGPIAAALFPDNEMHTECVRCRRREPGAPDRPQPYTMPPQFVDGKCPSRISP